ncbi:PTS sugar transporter subunit IIA [Lacticaseibacillus saniviri]|uniref:PTS system mannose-specific transporter subunit IIA n=1 Tax=Lacticaseibacillus saniviri JCM 17471 = DSM 24301 TaxID=1293598 RepID=A0A0R2MV65_9LACO|nr:PTS fructose transporter subunit IIA [Lacticaseibacillus saniviri]KRO17305.1 PTS system mannose-specific transporter subunit IIA [Lacticaseibacillus saniviri JCM 17471 = DSM 24301]
MNYQIAIVGHGNYPDGVVSALKLLAGSTANLTAFNLNEETTHEKFTQDVSQFLDQNDHVIVFADMTGGAPHQITARLILEKKRPYQYIISSAPVSLILDLYAQCQMGLDDSTIDQTLKDSLSQSKSLIQLMPLHDPVIDSLTEKIAAEDDDEGGI